MPISDPALILEATQALHLNQRTLAELLGVSLRTVQRNIRWGGITTAEQVQTLIRTVHPRNRELAGRLAASIRTDLVQLGLEAPAKPAGPPPAKREHADSVLCAAADALQMTPGNARPFVGAVFSRALELGVDLNALGQLFVNTAPSTKSTPR